MKLRAPLRLDTVGLGVPHGPRSACAALLLLCVTGCKQDPKPDQSSVPAVSSMVNPAASVEDGARPVASGSAGAEAPICVVDKEKVWGKWVNERTGITPTELPNSKLALGVAFGNQPAVLTLSPDGDAVLTRISQAEGSKVGRKLVAKDGRRDLQRVTPFVRDGKTHAYVDYRDRLTNGQRRVACGAAESDDTLLVFDGEPVLDKLAKQAKEAKPEEPTSGESVAAPGSAAAPGSVAAPGGAAVAAAPSAAPAPSGAAAPRFLAPAVRLRLPALRPPAGGTPEKLRELRDCRSFVDQRKGEVWSLASELVGEPKGDAYDWEMRFYIKTPSGAQVRLKTTSLGGKPKALHTLEAPVAARLGDDTLLVARYQGALLGWQLDANYKLKGAAKRFGGGSPSLPRFASDGDDLRLWVSQQLTKDDWRLASMRLSAGFARDLSKLELSEGSQAEPSYARTGSQRWLAYHEGPRRKATLQLQAVDGDLHPLGKSYQATPEGAEVYESLLVPLSGGKLYLVMLRTSAGESAPELVTQQLTCTPPA